MTATLEEWDARMYATLREDWDAHITTREDWDAALLERFNEIKMAECHAYMYWRGDVEREERTAKRKAAWQTVRLWTMGVFAFLGVMLAVRVVVWYIANQ